MRSPLAPTKQARLAFGDSSGRTKTLGPTGRWKDCWRVCKARFWRKRLRGNPSAVGVSLL